MMSVRLTKTIYLTLFFISLAFALHIVFVGSTQVDRGAQIAKREQRLLELAEEKHRLQQEIATSTALSTVAQVATTQGFVPVQKPIALNISALVASR